jgi:hypothetical protein
MQTDCNAKEANVKQRIDGYLSRLAGEVVPGAMVVCTYVEGGKEEWALVRPGKDDLGLGSNFGSASPALRAWIASVKAQARVSK